MDSIESIQNQIHSVKNELRDISHARFDLYLPRTGYSSDEIKEKKKALDDLSQEKITRLRDLKNNLHIVANSEE
jgi:hypothetical protein